MPDTKTSTLKIRVTPELLRLIDEAADRAERTRSDWARRQLKEAAEIERRIFDTKTNA